MLNLLIISKFDTESTCDPSVVTHESMCFDPIVDSPIPVANKRRKSIHRVLPGMDVSICNWWSCGTPASPHMSANFIDIDQAWKKCTKCWSWNGLYLELLEINLSKLLYLID